MRVTRHAVFAEPEDLRVGYAVPLVRRDAKRLGERSESRRVLLLATQAGDDDEVGLSGERPSEEQRHDCHPEGAQRPTDPFDGGGALLGAEGSFASLRALRMT